ncbi:PaaI family thioesterase [Paracoccus sp. (in: a-proteobacteria)]|uniref:PaaI family thioesterase n=1 Tax=Paracoccus sp. TaxID=267 RepID=UPI003A85FCF5
MTNGDDAPEGFAPLANATEGERFNGPYYIRSDPQGATLGFRCKARHLNAAGSCHGGLLAVFADMLGYGIRVGDHSGAAPTITLSLDFLAPVHPGDWVEARPEITRDTRSLTFFQALIRVGGQPVARCNGIYKKRNSGHRAAE